MGGNSHFSLHFDVFHANFATKRDTFPVYVHDEKKRRDHLVRHFSLAVSQPYAGEPSFVFSSIGAVLMSALRLLIYPLNVEISRPGRVNLASLDAACGFCELAAFKVVHSRYGARYASAPLRLTFCHASCTSFTSAVSASLCLSHLSLFNRQYHCSLTCSVGGAWRGFSDLNGIVFFLS